MPSDAALDVGSRDDAGAVVDAGVTPSEPSEPSDDIETELRAYCAQVATCNQSGSAGLEGCLAGAPPLDTVARVDHADCRALLAGFRALYRCRAGLACPVLLDENFDACPRESRTVLDLLISDAHLCLRGRAPVQVPTTWTCNEFYYAGGAADGCDCGCGAIDPDCERGSGCAESGCYEASCEYCYTNNMDLGCVAPLPPVPDAGPPVVDAGVPAKPASSGCSAADAEHLSGMIALWLAGAFFLLPRRRVRRA